MHNVLGVQKQSLGLGQITTKVRSESHEHYCSDRHNGIEDLVITLIDSADILKELRKKELS